MKTRNQRKCGMACIHLQLWKRGREGGVDEEVEELRSPLKRETI